MKNEELKQRVLDHLAYHTNIKFDVCKDFPKIKKQNGRKFLIIETSTNNRFNSGEWLRLERCVNESLIIDQILPAGYQRVAVYFNENELVPAN